MALLVDLRLSIALPDGETIVAMVQQADLIHNATVTDMGAEADLAVAALRTMSDESLEKIAGRIREWAMTVERFAGSGGDGDD